MQTNADDLAVASQSHASHETVDLQFKPQNVKPVYRELANHQQTEQAWDLRELMTFLQIWSTIFIERFELNINEIALCVDWLNPRCGGHYRHKFNGFGLWGEIAINRRYLDSDAPWEVLGTLAHELIHAWQEVHGKPAKPGRNNYHNVEYRVKAAEFGLLVDVRGRQQYAPDSMFFRLLAEKGVDFPKLPEPESRLRTPTKLKKWSCQCVPPVNARVAIADFHAMCLRCNTVFRLQGQRLG